HIDDAFETEIRAHRRGGDAMLTGAGFGDDALFAHAAGEQNLPEHIVQLVRTGVIEFFALQVNPGAAEMPAQALREIERTRTADIILAVKRHLGLIGGIVLRLIIGALQFEHERHQGLGDEAAAIDAEMTMLVGTEAQAVGLVTHETFSCRGRTAARARATKDRILSGLFSPGVVSTPDETSTPS